MALSWSLCSLYYSISFPWFPVDAGTLMQPRTVPSP